VVIGAIIIATVEEPAISTAFGIDEPHVVVKGPLGCVEIMGRSVVERMVERFLEADVELVSVLHRSTSSATVVPAVLGPRYSRRRR
jgi:hypothetical protein